MSETRPRKTILSRRVARDMEHERYHPELEQEIKECLYCLECNARMFDLEVDPDLVEQRIYERQALLCRYRYLLQRARELGFYMQKYCGCIFSEEDRYRKRKKPPKKEEA